MSTDNLHPLFKSIFDPFFIGDFAADGMDSVPSYDYGYNEGGNGPEPVITLRNDPSPCNGWSDEDYDRLQYEQMTEGEKERAQDEFLKTHGIL